MVDVCMVVAYGTYHKQLWVPWVKGTLIFIFVICGLVYYSNLIDQIKEHYFPKKAKTQKKYNPIKQLYGD